MKKRSDQTVCPCPTASEGSTVVGRAGGEVTLSCKYDISLQGALSACWGRGALPASGCGGQLLSTDGQRVKDGSPASGRYRLLGALGAGDVSLTISNLTGADGGRYGCRVETTSSSWTASPWETASNATGHVTSSRHLATSSSSGITAERSPGGDLPGGEFFFNSCSLIGREWAVRPHGVLTADLGSDLLKVFNHKQKL
ncbi:T-cell immunoglobulin and mucin domain-containing protein 4 [Liparis tanakae]|nr:T-cell immunoglobulin and mucin domain-containing protein 4 [Liparis tanakae]